MNRKNVKNTFISVIVDVFIVGFSSIFFIDSLLYIGFLPLFMIISVFSFGPRYFFYFHGIYANQCGI